jgi:hypothetical protein
MKFLFAVEEAYRRENLASEAGPQKTSLGLGVDRPFDGLMSSTVLAAG